jgi:hypothetical protein
MHLIVLLRLQQALRVETLFPTHPSIFLGVVLGVVLDETAQACRRRLLPFLWHCLAVGQSTALAAARSGTERHLALQRNRHSLQCSKTSLDRFQLQMLLIVCRLKVIRKQRLQMEAELAEVQIPSCFWDGGSDSPATAIFIPR